MNEDDEFAKLSAEDRAKLALLEQEFERDGDVAIERFAEKEPIAMGHIIECLKPGAIKRAIEKHLINEGLTNAEFREMLEKAFRERKH
jgi:hypothetical protein